MGEVSENPVRALNDLVRALEVVSAHLDRREPVRAHAERITPAEIETGRRELE